MSIELQCIDTNCNDCKHLVRLFGKDGAAATNAAGKPTVFYGQCDKKEQRVTFMPGTCCPSNADCFVHRKSQSH